MKKKIGIVLLCVVMFIAGCVVTGLSWRSDADKMADRVAELEQSLAEANEQVLELKTEAVLHSADMKKLEAVLGKSVDEILIESGLKSN